MAGRQMRLKGRGAFILLLAAMVVAFVLMAASPAFGGPPWSDASNAWWVSSYAVTDTQAATVADGYPDGTFRPGLAVTRAQFTKMAVDGLGVATANPSVPTFSDVPASNYYYPWIEGGVGAGLINGLGNGVFGPNQDIIRQQANSILGNYLAQKELMLRGHIAGEDANYSSLNTWYLAEGSALLSTFADVDRLATVHAPATAYLVYKGVVQGTYSQGWMYLGPDDNLTRAQAVALILRVQGVTFSTALPTVTNLNPSSGLPAGGNSVVITGTNFTDVTSVKFGTTTATFVVNSPTQITATAPAGTLGTTVDVTVTTPAGTSATSSASKYSYGLPTITALSPASGSAAGGNSVIITGTSLTGATSVKFGTKTATFTVNSSTQITATAPSGTAGTTVDVTVTTPGGTTATSAASKYSYGAPTVTGLTPTNGPAVGGTSVVISGTGFSGVSAVKFGTKAATSFVVNSPTSITAVSPSGTVGSVVDVTVTTSAGTSGVGIQDKFSYYGPMITLLTPNSGPAAGSNLVTITGTGFTGVSAVYFGTSAAISFTVDSSTQIRAIAPPGTTGTSVYVTVTTASGTSPQNDASIYTYGAPFITGLTPSFGPPAGGNTVIITGGGFVGVTSVKFGNTSVLFHVDSSTQISATAPSGTAGTTVQVTVTAAGGTSSTAGTANDYTYGVAYFVVTMSGGTTPLGASTKTAGHTYAVRVTAKDAGDHTITGFTGTVDLTSNAWVGTFHATITQNGYVDGVPITPTIAGTLRTITATWATYVTTDASGSFTVVPGHVERLQVLAPGQTAAPGTVTGKTGTPNAQGAGVAFNITVNAVDDWWNVVTSVDDEVSLTSSDGSATLPVAADLLSGTKTFLVTLNTAGNQTVTAHDDDDTHVDDGTSSPISVTAYAHLVLVVPGETLNEGTSPGKTGSPSDRTAGTPFNVDVYAMDAGWNVVTSVIDEVAITTTCPSHTLPSNADLVLGHGTFSVTLKTAGTAWTITATDVDVAGRTATSPAITVVAGAPTQVDSRAWRVNNGSPGPWFTTTPATVANGDMVDFRMRVLDAYGNPVTDTDISSVHPLLYWAEIVGGSLTGITAPDSTTTNSSGFIQWTGGGGVSDSEWDLSLGLDLDNSHDPTGAGEPWGVPFDLTWESV